MKRAAEITPFGWIKIGIGVIGSLFFLIGLIEIMVAMVTSFMGIKGFENGFWGIVLAVPCLPFFLLLGKELDIFRIHSWPKGIRVVIALIFLLIAVGFLTRIFSH